VRTLLFTGKGGVGKTTVAAATAVRCADEGLRTLVISTDPAHSLADAFDHPLDGSVRTIAPNLHGQQLDAQDRMEASWGEIKAYLLEVFDWAGVERLEAEELAVVPGLEELFALTDINEYAASGAWDVLVVDCGPTAETIRLLSLPGILEWYMERAFPVGRRINRMVGPVLAKVTSLPVADDRVFGAAHRLYRKLEGVKAVLGDGERTSIRLVVHPERVVVAEARRTHTYLSLYGYGVDAVVANRLLPDSVSDPWLVRWQQIHAAHLADIEAGFAPLPVLRAPWAPDEPVGVDRLRDLAGHLYGSSSPVQVLHRGDPFTVAREDGTYVLRLKLPFTDRDDVTLSRRPDEILVRVGPYRRSLLLPESLRRRPVASAQLRDGVLRIAFADPPGGAEPRHPRPAAWRRGGEVTTYADGTVPRS
jgi:arsenite/tail-anchored protein-transporting ATPase